jgi:hypothetical protein
MKWQCYDSNRLNLLASEATEGIRWLFKVLLVIAHFLEGQHEKNFYLAAIVDTVSDNVPMIDVDSEDHGICVRKRS